MFDQGNEPQDIFAETETAKPSGMKPGGSARPAPLGAGRETGIASGAAAHGPSKLIFAVIALVVLGGIGAGAYFWFFRKAPAPVAAPVEQQSAQQEAPKEAAQDTTPAAAPVPAPAPTQEAPAAAAPTPDATTPVLPPDAAAAPVDTDGDGLSDVQEAQLGTNPNVADTDNDGLSDKEEVDIYKTDPKNPDTDGDGFLDGQEVRGGYNPNGPGRLFTVPPSKP